MAKDDALLKKIFKDGATGEKRKEWEENQKREEEERQRHRAARRPRGHTGRIRRVRRGVRDRRRFPLRGDRLEVVRQVLAQPHGKFARQCRR